MTRTSSNSKGISSHRANVDTIMLCLHCVVHSLCHPVAGVNIYLFIYFFDKIFTPAAVDNVCSVDSNLYGQGLTPAGKQVITGSKVSDAVCAIGKLFSATSETFCPLVPMFDGPYVKLSG